MRNSQKFAIRWWKKLNFRSFLIRKKIYQLLNGLSSHQKDILFVIGCQRSGTTLMERVFERDLKTKVFEERGELTIDDKREQIRLNSISSVKETIRKQTALLIILKPLVETQNALELFDNFTGAKALWMYRHYKDVAASNLAHFGIGNGINNLRPIVNNDPDNWRSENVPDYVRTIVLKYFSEDMNPYDAAALFWFVRNSFFFELSLDAHPDVIICRYVDMVKNPVQAMKMIYGFIGHEFPGERIVAQVHSSSVAKGENIDLSLEIDLLCQDLLAKLDEAYNIQKAILDQSLKLPVML